MGRPLRIEAAYIADGGKLPDGSIPVMFDSSMSRMVLPGETFWSDAAEITIRKSIIWYFRGRSRHSLRATASPIIWMRH
ncbi:hypothetical protein QFZ77_006419 [Paenibacillus sp. V4I3]|uniref:hypothetical protein n=1 Tax=unclassified Paenibacillus TaxID=185978 RepID=UPI00277E4470|nr:MULTISPECIES: hypothetical protein [unclassified Paenibacillus]MDQ0877760.1 hypothetical protein [Paenibacillus sp. V4I3]MDQ0886366.1 hypothetical protein [Paenibacillus sp. V4I9]